ncbi:hypothetical protein BV22DRAFT_825229 [Leucogyrophana mollusca]|uniref:Uncharacterized protein n=1 Tax=Leucogyrophana mollusca TaxID=85980 RepID=A0ACB8B3V3_9AGAM|nr:hypothetical protein BV22DRAFT_825229 [Leucogyrophana mollusca]
MSMDAHSIPKRPIKDVVVDDCVDHTLSWCLSARRVGSFNACRWISIPSPPFSAFCLFPCIIFRDFFTRFFLISNVKPPVQNSLTLTPSPTASFLPSFPQRPRQPPPSSHRVERHCIQIPNHTYCLCLNIPTSCHHTPASHSPRLTSPRHQTHHLDPRTRTRPPLPPLLYSQPHMSPLYIYHTHTRPALHHPRPNALLPLVPGLRGVLEAAHHRATKVPSRG